MQNKQLQKCYLQLEKLIKDKAIPPKMQLKLQYLQLALTNHHGSDEELQKLQQFEKESLKTMNRETQIQLFISIIRCLSGRNMIQYFQNQKVMVKKKEILASMLACRISCDNNKLTLQKIKNSKAESWKEFLIEKMNISQLYQKSKNGYAFMLSYDNNKYQMKISQEGRCARIHGLLKNAIRMKRSKQQEKPFQFIYQPLEYDKEQSIVEESPEELLISEERQYLINLKNEVESVNMSQNGFSLIKNIHNGKIQGNKKDCIRILMFFEGCSIQNLIQSYIRFNAWNINVDEFKILKKIRSNTYLAHLKFKKTSFLAKQRETYFYISYLKYCQCLFQQGHIKEQDEKGSFVSASSQISYKCINKHFIIMNSVDYKEESLPSGLVRADFNQIIQFSEFQDKKHTVFVKLLSRIDFKGYQLLSSNIDQNVNFMSDIPSISVYCKEQQAYNNTFQLFQFNRCTCNVKITSNIQDTTSHKGSEIKQSVIYEQLDVAVDSQQVKLKQREHQKRQILGMIKNGFNHKLNKALIDVIRKKSFEVYYLKLKFDQSVDESQYVKSWFQMNTNPQYLLQNGRWQFKENQDYIFVDQRQLAIQKGVIKLLAKQITSNILAGKSIMTMSLPVEIFYQYSLLEALAFIFGFVPKYMHQATAITDIVQQIKHVAIAFMFMWACNPQISKPFNPILGETYQGIIGGIPIFFQQISHHPPISAFYMKTSKFQAYGNFDLNVDIGLNSAYSKVHGPFYVKTFQTNAQYVIKFPQIQTSGIMYGDRRNRSTGKGYVLQKNSNIYFQYSVGKEKKKVYENGKKTKPNDLIGGIYKVTKEFASKLLKTDKTKSVEGAKPEDIVEKLSHMSGRWYGQICFNNIQYKSMNHPSPILPIRQSVVLPSDSMFRQDVYYKQMQDNKTSNEQKQILQNLQRRDRKLRQKHGKKH